MISTLGEPSQRLVGQGVELLVYQDKKAPDGAVQVQLRLDEATGVVFHIDVAPSAKVDREAVENTYGSACPKGKRASGRHCYVEKLDKGQRCSLHYNSRGLVVYLSEEPERVTRFVFFDAARKELLEVPVSALVPAEMIFQPVVQAPPEKPEAPTALPFAGDDAKAATNSALAPPKKPTGWTFQGLPQANYSSDDGIGYGARVQLVHRGNGEENPYRYRLMAQFFQTTNNVAYHRLFFDAPRLGGAPLRLDVDLDWYQDKFSPYYGLGNGTAYEREFDTCADRQGLRASPDVCPGNDDFRGLRYYTFSKDTVPRLKANIRVDLAQGWKGFVGYRLFRTTIAPRYGSSDLGQSGPSRLLEDGAQGLLTGFPDGYDFDRAPSFVGTTGELTAGLVLDNRDKETSPTLGMFHELSGRYGHPALGSDFTYWGANLNARFFVPLWPGSRRLIAAARVLGDVLGGEVPFWMLSATGGIDGPDGVGGGYSARGVSKNRLQGRVKLVVNSELRWTFAQLSSGSQTFDFGLVGAFDLGRVWIDLDSLRQRRDPGGFAQGATVGLRFAWNESFLVRLDYAVLAREKGGLYFIFDQMF